MVSSSKVKFIAVFKGKEIVSLVVHVFLGYSQDIFVIVVTVYLSLIFQGIKLSGFSELLKIRATEAKVPFPSRHDWDSFFRDAKHMNEMKPGERPDTVHFQVSADEFFRILFEAYGDFNMNLVCFRNTITNCFYREIHCSLVLVVNRLYHLDSSIS